jgi:hypothetical protein
MTAAIEQQERTDYEHAVKAVAASPLSPAAVLDDALNALDACVND